MDPALTNTGFLRPFFEGVLTLSPSLFYLQFVQLWTDVLNGFFGILGFGPVFQAF